MTMRMRGIGADGRRSGAPTIEEAPVVVNILDAGSSEESLSASQLRRQ